MERFFTKLSMLIVIALAFQMEGIKGCSEEERFALLEIKSFYINSSKTFPQKLQSWVDDGVPNCCSWDRVACNTTTGRVMNLLLSGLLHDGSTSILNFSLFQPFEELQILDLSNNYFFEGWVDGIGGGLQNLRNLRFLDLSSNYMSGFIQELGLTSMRNLKFLDLSFNHLSGSLQESGLTSMRNLKFLDLSFTNLSGSLQESGICELKNLIELDLSGNRLKGHLPMCLNNLTKLRALELSYNQLSGNFPSALASLISLEYLSLLRNNFGGPFSFRSLANLSKLEIFRLSIENNTVEIEELLQPPTHQLKILQLSYCNLQAIPSFLMYQHSLEFIGLSHNLLVGMFPTWLLNNNTRLKGMSLMNNSLTGSLQLPNSKHGLLQLQISNNNLNGQLPKNISLVLPNLTHLALSKNSFEGYIPSLMGEMTSLYVLDLSSNNFSGELPRALVSGCFSLELLGLSNNNFHGEIFPEFMNMTKLNWLYLDNNQFSGKIQVGLSKASSLMILDLSNNFFSGQIPHWIGNFSYLWTLLMSNNLFEGGVPIELSNIELLQFLDISENRLSGSMASSLNLSTVQHLYLQKNAINGSIPNAFLRSSKLVTLDLTENEFSGSIPNQIDADHTNLRFLLLGGNHLKGHIPHELCTLKNLSILDLSRNRLNGTIPSCFVNILLWAEENTSNYQLATGYPRDVQVSYFFVKSYNFTLKLMNTTGNVVLQFKELVVEFVTKNRHESYVGSILQYMVGLDLSENELSGDIPSEIGYLQNIHALNLSHNFLSGPIPKSFSNLKKIESLDLSWNKLSGQIPQQLTELYSLAIFNVSFNNLSGPTPSGGQFANFDESNYGGNRGLCGSQIKRSCSSEPKTPLPSHAGEEEEEESTIDMVSLRWSTFASYITTILGFVLILYLNPYWRRQWFYFIDTCITISYCWILRYVFHSHM